jgi:hypothetical protein
MAYVGEKRTQGLAGKPEENTEKTWLRRIAIKMDLNETVLDSNAQPAGHMWSAEDTSAARKTCRTHLTAPTGIRAYRVVYRMLILHSERMTSAKIHQPPCSFSVCSNNNQHNCISNATLLSGILCIS